MAKGAHRPPTPSKVEEPPKPKPPPPSKATSGDATGKVVHSHHHCVSQIQLARLYVILRSMVIIGTQKKKNQKMMSNNLCEWRIACKPENLVCSSHLVAFRSFYVSHSLSRNKMKSCVLCVLVNNRLYVFVDLRACITCTYTTRTKYTRNWRIEWKKNQQTETVQCDHIHMQPKPEASSEFLAGFC